MRRVNTYTLPFPTKPGMLLAVAAGVLLCLAILIGSQAFATSENNPDTIQELVDQAEPGEHVQVPAGIYRETVVIDKPITLLGSSSAEIRGSDVWDDGWKSSGEYWTRGTLPDFYNSRGYCVDDLLCVEQEQVFLDGEPLEQVEEDPESGQFSVTPERHIVLADDPSDRKVEVSTREHWLVGEADDVVIDGFTMTHAANAAQTGGIQMTDVENWVIHGNVLSHTHGSAISYWGAQNLEIAHNHIHHAGQLGIHGWDATNLQIMANLVEYSNQSGYYQRWDAGGIKITESLEVVIANNFVRYSEGTGIWCDLDCNNVSIINNRVSDNTFQGINYEISANGRIQNNVVYQNGSGSADWGWGAGILVQNSRNTIVSDNIVAWNADGISVISQNRGGNWNRVRNNQVTDNVIAVASWGGEHVYSHAWLQDWEGGLSDPDSGNMGARNRYAHVGLNEDNWSLVFGDRWFPSTELDAFSETDAEDGGLFLSSAERFDILFEAGIPSTPPVIERVQD